MKITRRESIKTIIWVLGTPLLLGGEAVAAEKFKFSEELSGRIAEDSYQTDVYPPHVTRAIYDFKRGEEQGKSEISFEHCNQEYSKVKALAFQRLKDTSQDKVLFFQPEELGNNEK